MNKYWDVTGAVLAGDQPDTASEYQWPSICEILQWPPP
jgi:hypothetical protein